MDLNAEKFPPKWVETENVKEEEEGLYENKEETED